MDYTKWHVGMKVVYDPVEDTPDSFEFDLDDSFVVGQIYTISKIIMSNNQVVIDLLENPSPATKDYGEGVWAGDFKPVQTKKTDISIFTEMLNKDYSRNMENV